MKEESATSRTPSFQSVEKRFKAWRRRRRHREPIPEKLWAAAVKLARRHSMLLVARRLRLNYTNLHKRVNEGEVTAASSRLSLVEVPMGIAQELGWCEVQVVRSDGQRMRVVFRQEPGEQLVELCRSLWRREP